MLRAAENDAPTEEPEVSAPADDGAGRLLVQRGPFTGPSDLVPEDLYAEVLRGTARRERTGIRLTPGTLVTTNTYWGRLHATYWQRWTAVREVRVDLHAAGTGRVRLMASDTNKVPRTVAVANVDGSGEVVLTGAIDRFLDGGGMWLEMVTDVGELTVSDVRWSVPRQAADRPTSMTICTFNRVEDCLNTLQALGDDPEALERLEIVRVVDQGTDPLESRDRFTEVMAGLGAKLRYQRQPNLGGAGGFTRGLFEATAGAPESDHDVLLMDDDVLLEPEIVVRLTGFAACTTHPTIVGGQMLNLLHPDHVHITAEYALPEKMKVGIPVPGAMREAHLLGRDERLLPMVQDRRVDTEYNGWWSCLIPAAIVRAVGYPLPLFFQWDDVEFGYRAREHGFPTVSLPGAGVWHADFGWKDWDEWHRYFNQRNGLITAALRTGFDRRVVTGTVIELLAQYLVAMQYGLAATLLQAVEDFLDGPSVLDDGSAHAAAEIRRIRAEYPETKAVPIDELGLDFRETQVHLAPPGKPSKMVRTWGKRLLLQATGRVPFRTGMVPAGEAHWWFVSLFERAIVTDMAETGVRVRTRDRDRQQELVRRATGTVRRLWTDGGAVAQQWRDAAPRLTARENWARLYGLTEER
ncbi:glycosyltransferase [Pseudonocardia endophytica]|uniref:Galactofuranosylgalactofuranosylrhamnosyl-N-acetylglucosaminyl-diphospho-decaprenol beta-1,5/1,6-galactofuranosyltransferase n=1 Tax=Pseudonocardia endophytica TaxID=401976 RepID=A0A4R1IAJ8_PSEEN|nr:galactofuranosylgalactofuranosylrhamnosyl-N-acetylglucosaminyl-diphospho-decaprenol beta-1,5/1,6-galactofuranosyltransferase [Pseudonocardia endophytica]